MVGLKVCPSPKGGGLFPIEWMDIVTVSDALISAYKMLKYLLEGDEI